MRREKSGNTPYATGEGGARTDGAAGSHRKGGTTNRLVRGNGSCTEAKWESTHLCRPHQAQ